MTIYVEDIREEIKRIPNPVVYADELTELLDAYEERERLREILVRLRTRMAEPQQPIIQWDAGTWIERIDAALEGRE